MLWCFISIEYIYYNFNLISSFFKSFPELECVILFHVFKKTQSLLYPRNLRLWAQEPYDCRRLRKIKLSLSKSPKSELFIAFFDAEVMRKEIGFVINDELLFLLLYSLSASNETFRYALETQDELPKPDVLYVKILDEYESRKSEGDKIEKCLT